MRPVGKERDILIAKLKGLKEQKLHFYPGILNDNFEFTSNCAYCDCWMGVIGSGGSTDPFGECPNAPSFYKDIKEWSTDRNAAWELWDELPYKKYFNEKGRNYCDLTVVNSFIKTKVLFVQGEDFADCVSQAWVIWEGGKK